jgi:nitroimidazol reductase NimA-like FMN-containing flavoprotein (pyridoxamine 5'-phosphate oxidase superfamily)
MSNNPISKLDAHESWALLSGVRLGRLTASTSGTPDIHPVSYIVHAGRILLRTGVNSRLLNEVADKDVAFEAAWQEVDNAWSVVALGHAHVLDDAERAELDGLPILDFAPNIDDAWIAITPTELRGRRFDLLGEES